MAIKVTRKDQNEANENLIRRFNRKVLQSGMMPLKKSQISQFRSVNAAAKLSSAKSVAPRKPNACASGSNRQKIPPPVVFLFLAQQWKIRRTSHETSARPQKWSDTNHPTILWLASSDQNLQPIARDHGITASPLRRSASLSSLSLPANRLDSELQDNHQIL